MKTLCYVLIVFFGISLAHAKDEPNISQQTLSNYRFVEGDWIFLNQSLQPDLSSVYQYFYVNSKISADGHMLKHMWNEFKGDVEINTDNLLPLKNIKKMTKDYALVLETYDPQKESMVTNFFNIATSAWQINESQPTISEGLVESSGNDSDGFGPFQYYIKLEKLSDNQYQWVSQRLYASLGFWITVDSYVATRIID